MDERIRRFERSALSLGGLLTAGFGLTVVGGFGRGLPVVRDVHEAWPSITPAAALWLLLAGLALVALGSGPDGFGPLTRVLRVRVSGRSLVLGAAATGTVLATGVALHNAGEERDSRHATVVALAQQTLRATTAVPLDRLRDVAATVRGPESLGRREFDSLTERLFRQPAVASIALVRSLPHPAPSRSAVPETRAPLERFELIFASYHGAAPASAGALEGRRFRTVLRSAIHSHYTRATLVLPRRDGAPSTMFAVIPVRRSPSGGPSGALVASFPVDRARDAVAQRLPANVDFALAEGTRAPRGFEAASLRRVGVGDGAWTVAVKRPPRGLGLAVATLFGGGLLTVLIAVLGSQAARRERHSEALIEVRRAERDRAESARRAAEARSRVLAETSTDLICVLTPSGGVRYVSPASRDLLGYDPDELVGTDFLALVHPDDAIAIAALLEPAAGEGPVTITHRLLRRTGVQIWVESRVRLVIDPATDAVAEAHITVRDVEDRLRAQAALTEAEEHFRSAFEEAPIGMALTSPDFRFLRVNRALCAITGYTRAQLEGLPTASITHPEDLKADREARSAMLQGDMSAYHGERRYLHASGSAVWVLINSTLVRDANGAPLHFLSQMQDVTERRRHEAELRHMADHDPLTGLLNRRSFERELQRHVAHVERYGPQGAAIVLDLDHFKTVNDTLGHSAGDELIVRVAHALQSRLRESDVLARLGGDEFAILLSMATPEEAHAVAEAVLESVRTQTVPTATGRTRTVTASLGLALFSRDPQLTGEEVLVNADLAMYDAKEAGRDRLGSYVSAEYPEVRLEARMSWADLIRDALAEDRFVLHAQPIVDLATGEATQHELLLRMRSADGELIPPSAFLPVAERFDLMPAIDRWVVAHAIRMVGDERRRGRELVVEVNISGGSTGDPELLALIERELGASEVDPAQIIFEITETIAVNNIPRAQHFAARLADLGCRFALDDFGAGFGSFYYLKHLPFEYLKIDGEFVRHSTEDTTDQLVIQAVVDIARGLGKRTIAEHVGDARTVALLRRLGVHHAQGFHLGRPAPLCDWIGDAGAVALRS